MTAAILGNIAMRRHCIKPAIGVHYRQSAILLSAVLLFIVSLASLHIYQAQAAPGPTTRIRPRPTLSRRFECRDTFPRKTDDFPDAVISGRVLQLFMPTDNSTTSYKASVIVQRVIKPIGSKQQQINDGATIVVINFNETSTASSQAANTWCQNNVRPNDTWIFLLNHVGDKLYSLNSTLLAPNLANFDRINAAQDDSFKRRPPIVETPCERHYCPFNGDCIEPEAGATGPPKCECPAECTSAELIPVCGSDNKTYASECHMRYESCRAKQTTFVVKLTPCLLPS